MSQDPLHDGANKGDVDEGDVVEVRFVPEFEGRGLLGVHALCVDRRLTAPDMRCA